MPAGSGRSIYTRGLGSQEKKFKTATFFKDLLSYTLIQWGFTEKFLIMKLLRSDGCFTITLAALGSISYLYTVPYRQQTITISQRFVVAT